MRLRKRPWIDKAILEFKDFVFLKDSFEPTELKGHWRDIFNRNAPLYVELGTGKGRFINQLALQYPEVNFLGIELQQDIIYYAAQKAAKAKLTNIRLAVFNINAIDSLFAEDEIDRLYINFCDPWPKKRHAKRRLTHINFLIKYQKILKSSARLFFKTDNRDLFDFSLEQFKEADCKTSAITYDLHNDTPIIGDVMTEYEEKFSGFGEKINRCEVTFS